MGYLITLNKAYKGKKEYEADHYSYSYNADHTKRTALEMITMEGVVMIKLSDVESISKDGVVIEQFNNK